VTLGIVVLPVSPGVDAFVDVEQLGFDSVWTYDHVEWGGWKGKPWFGAYPTLAAVAQATTRIRLGPLVASINLRDPIELAQHLVTIDQLSGGRFDLGIGAGTSRGADAGMHGGEPWTAGERVARFGEYLELLDRLLTAPVTDAAGDHYDAVGAPFHAGCVQSPRVPFTVAADGPRSMGVAARFGDRWVANTVYGEPEEKSRRLDAACEAIGRDPSTLERVLLVDQPTHEVDSVERWVERSAAMGFAATVFRYPHGGDRRALELLASR
jgi:alkanesulfonate monooxygenase SsuD/methylene tetrahydromethanopterin reductase-like flavin-dependent oxidoreductase (luciferase family)